MKIMKNKKLHLVHWSLPDLPKVNFSNHGTEDDEGEEEMLAMIANQDLNLQQFRLDEIKKSFNLFTLHTKIPVTKKIFKEISETPGVEILLPVSSYQIRIAIAKLHKVAEVKNKLNDLLSDHE